MSEVELFPGYVSRLGLGVIPREELARHSGLVLLRRLIAGEYPAPPMAGTLNFGLTEVDMAGRCFAGCPTSATSIRWARFTADGRRRSWIQPSAAPSIPRWRSARPTPPPNSR